MPSVFSFFLSRGSIRLPSPLAAESSPTAPPIVGGRLRDLYHPIKRQVSAGGRALDMVPPSRFHSRERGAVSLLGGRGGRGGAWFTKPFTSEPVEGRIILPTISRTCKDGRNFESHALLSTTLQAGF